MCKEEAFVWMYVSVTVGKWVYCLLRSLYVRGDRSVFLEGHCYLSSLVKGKSTSQEFTV